MRNALIVLTMMPGYYRPVLFDLESRREILPDLAPAPHFNTINLRWEADGKKLSGRAMSRGYKSIFLLEVDARSGRIDTIYREASDTNIDFYNFHVHRLEKDDRIFLASEWSGWSQLYQLDTRTGELAAITGGTYVINDLVYVDESNQQIYFTATGKEFDMLILPSQRHGYQGVHGEYFTLKRWNYFIKHLLGADTLWGWEN